MARQARQPLRPYLLQISDRKRVEQMFEDCLCQTPTDAAIPVFRYINRNGGQALVEIPVVAWAAAGSGLTVMSLLIIYSQRNQEADQPVGNVIGKG